MSKTTNLTNGVPKATGLLVIEAINSNPNGDPDKESDPRTFYDDRGYITGVSFKRKTRDLIEDKDGPVWKHVSQQFKPVLKENRFQIQETPDCTRSEMFQEVEDGTFLERRYDARIYGTTFLEDDKAKKQHEKRSIKRTGVIQIPLGFSVAPIDILRLTNTKKAPAQEGKSRGMAPLGHRVVRHAIYCLPFFINPTAACKTKCTKQDIDVFLKTIPFAYSHTRSSARPHVEIVHAWYMEHNNNVGSCADLDLIAALTPKKKSDPDVPSQSREEYNIPTELPDELRSKLSRFEDLMKN